MSNTILSCFLVLSFLSCKEEVVRPDIPEDRLIELLADLHMIEMSMHQIPKYAKDSMVQVFRSQILEIYSLTEEELVKNIDVLQSDPNYYFEISKKVADLTKKEKQDYTDKEKALKEEEKAKKPIQKQR